MMKAVTTIFQVFGKTRSGIGPATPSTETVIKGLHQTSTYLKNRWMHDNQFEFLSIPRSHISHLNNTTDSWMKIVHDCKQHFSILLLNTSHYNFEQSGQIREMYI